MPQPPSATNAHQRARWLKPGTDPADVYPTLKRQRDAVGYGPVAGGDRWG
jgi:hypothetical protein